MLYNFIMGQLYKNFIRHAGFTLLVIFCSASTVLAASTWKTQTSPNAQVLLDVYASSETTAVAVGVSKTVIKTTDRGENWASKTSSDPSINFIALHFPSPLTGYAVGTNSGNGYILKTSDGGENWTDSGITPPSPACFDVFFTSDSVGYVSTPRSGSGGVYKTTNGGSDWTDIGDGTSPLANANYYGLYFVDSSAGWVAGDGGRIYKTPNSGSDWFPKTSNTPIQLNDIFFYDANHGWAVGNNGVVTRTIDGGTSWESSTIDSAYYLMKVRFITDSTGWAAGYNPDTNAGRIYKSTDGGQNWSVDDSAGSPFYSVNFTDQYNGWAVGGASSLIKKYVVDPAVTTIEVDGRPDRPLNWSGTVTIEVTNLQTGATLESDIPLVETTRSASAITGTITLSASGVKTVTIYNPDTGSGSGTFTVNPLPIVGKATPSTMTQGDAGIVTIEGTGFQAGLTTSDIVFSLAGITVNSISRESQYKLLANITVAGGATTGSGNITVTNPDGGVGTGSGLFNVSPAGVTGPTILSVSPDSGTQGATSLDVTITGSNFHAGPPTVVLGNSGITVNSVTYNSATSLAANLTISATAPTTARTVTVTNTDDGGIGSLSGAFQVVNPGAIVPTITKITPASGNAGWSSYIIVTGTGFTYEAGSGQGSIVSFSPTDNISVSDTEFVDATHLRVYLAIDSGAPASTKNVNVVNPSGTSTTAANAFTINAVIDPTASPDLIQILFFPNPWNYNTNPNVVAQFDWPGAADTVKFVLVNSAGRIVKAPASVNVTPGRNTITFDSQTQLGQRLNSGLIISSMIKNNRVVGKGKLMVVPW